jgi:hypothetical protein
VSTIYNIQQIASGSASSIGAATEIELTIGDSLKTVQVDRVKLHHTAGTAASFTPRIHSATGGTAESTSQEFAASSTLVAVLCDVAAEGVICRTDASGKLYLLPVPNAGADNAFDYLVAYRVLA